MLMVQQLSQNVCGLPYTVIYLNLRAARTYQLPSVSGWQPLQSTQHPRRSLLMRPTKPCIWLKIAGGIKSVDIMRASLWVGRFFPQAKQLNMLFLLTIMAANGSPFLYMDVG